MLLRIVRGFDGLQDIERHLGIAYDVTMEMLAAAENGSGGARARNLDPIGAQALRTAKRFRRKELDLGALGSPARLLDLAEERFGVRSLELGYWARSGVERPWIEGPRLASTG